MNKLFKKLFRDIRKSLGQFIAVTVISAMGIMLLTGMAVVHTSMLNTTNNYYMQSNLADLSAYYLGIDDKGIDKIKGIKGIKDVYGRISLKAERNDNKSGFIVHTVSSDEKINIPLIEAGRLPVANNECMVDKAYASENNLNTGDKISVTINGKKYSFIISGIFDSSEYIYLLEDPTKSVVPNHKTFGLLYVNKSLISIITGSNTYNEVIVSLDKNINSSTVSKKIENATADYGFGSIILQKDQLSYQQLESDIVTTDSIAKIFPYIFFLVSAAILFISLSRTVQSERSQIGIMKALGISARSIALHYLSYSVLCGFAGSIIGNALGILIIPKIMINAYNMLYTFPETKYSGYLRFVVISTILVVVFGIIASLLSVLKVLKEVPASCMRPVQPKKVHKTWIEKRKNVWNKISYKNKLIIRNILLNKRRGILSSIGVIGCVGVLMCAFGLKEATSNLVNMQFCYIQKFDDMLLFSTPVSYTAPIPYKNKNIEHSDRFSSISSTISLSKDVNTILNVLPLENNSIQLYDINNKKLNLPDDGIVVPYKLAKEYHITVGDTLSVKLDSDLYNTKVIKAKVAAIDVLYLSQDLYASYEYLGNIGFTPYVNGYYIDVKNKTLLNASNKYLSSVANVKSVVKNSSFMNDIKQTMGMMNTMVLIMIFMSAALSLAVIFNISSINIFERRRDIATLKVLGYHKKEINSLVHVENFIITVLGAIFGLVFGAVIYKLVLNAVVSEDMFFPYNISLSMIIISVVLAFVFTAFANLMLKGKIRRIDMVESLKSVE